MRHSSAVIGMGMACTGVSLKCRWDAAAVVRRTEHRVHKLLHVLCNAKALVLRPSAAQRITTRRRRGACVRGRRCALRTRTLFLSLSLHLRSRRWAPLIWQELSNQVRLACEIRMLCRDRGVWRCHFRCRWGVARGARLALFTPDRRVLTLVG